MKDLAALVVIAILVWIAACFVTFEPDMTRWNEFGRYLYLLMTAICFVYWKAGFFSHKVWGEKK